MAETRTLRMGLPQWSSGQTDSPSREDFNEAFANIEKWALRTEFGPLTGRRAPGVENTAFVDTESGTIYRDTGSQWQQIGSPRNFLNIVKETGTDPAIRSEIPLGLTNDAFLSVHNGKNRFRVTANGDVVSSSVRLYQSDVLPPANNLPVTVGIIPKSAAASGLAVWGNPGQTGNLFESKTSAGADLAQINSSGDVNTIGRVSVGSLQPAAAQAFFKGTQEARPVVLARSSNPLLGTGPVLVAESSDGGFSLMRLDATGRLALGHRGGGIVATDLLALNTNIAGANNGTTPSVVGRVVFRNGANAQGIAGFDLRQEPGDGVNAGSLGIFAGSSGDNAESAERVRLGLNGPKIGARFTASAPDWSPLVVKGVAGQVADLLGLQRADGTVVAGIGADGAIRAKSLVTTSTEQSNFAGDIATPGTLRGSALKAIQTNANADNGILVRTFKNASAPFPFLRMEDEAGKSRARINYDGSLEIGMDTDVLTAGATLLRMRGQDYRQNGRKLQSFDQEAGRWGSFESAFAAEYYSLTAQNVKNQWVGIIWNGEANDTEGAFGYVDNSSKVTVPFTGWYDVRALAHCDMNFTGSGSATFQINNVIEMKYRRDYARALGWDVVTLTLNDLVYLNRGDSLEFVVQIDSFLFTTKTKNTGDYRSRMSIRFAGNA